MIFTFYDDKFLKKMKRKDLKNYKYDLIQEIKQTTKYNEVSFIVHKIDKIDKELLKRKIKYKKN